jgi:hypothetical protein
MVPEGIDPGATKVKLARADGAFTRELPFQVIKGKPKNKAL